MPCSLEKIWRFGGTHHLHITWITLLPWRWRPYVPSKRRTFSELHSIITQKTVLLTDWWLLRTGCWVRHLSVRGMSVCLSVCLPACLPACLPVCLSVRPSSRPPTHPSFYLSIYLLPTDLSIYLYLRNCIYTYIYIYIYICLSVCLCVCLSTSIYLSIRVHIFLNLLPIYVRIHTYHYDGWVDRYKPT
jgi:hypothetical protein